MYRSLPQFEGGREVDPQAEAELFRWATQGEPQAREEIPTAFRSAAPACDPDPYELRLERSERRTRELELAEGAFQ